MRAKPVAMEKLFWSKVRDRQLGGYKFRRQVPIGPYIADFVCAERKVIVELDGPLHADRAGYDKARDQLLERQGYRVLRFSNDYTAEDLGTLLLTVLDTLERVAPSP